MYSNAVFLPYAGTGYNKWNKRFFILKVDWISNVNVRFLYDFCMCVKL